ncbi:MAG: acetyl-CoA acetyltransferase [Agathobacter sp.]
MDKKSLNGRVAVIGTGITRFGDRWDRSGSELVADAVFEACRNANVDLQKDVEAGWVGSVYDYSGSAPNTLADAVALYDKPVTRISNWCDTGMDAFRNAALAIASGMYDIVVACGVEKMYDSGGRGIKMDGAYPHIALNGQSAPAIFAPCATRAFHEWGWTKEDLATVAVKNHFNGAHHPLATFQNQITMDMAMNAPMISWPLGLFDCCGMADGATAIILTTPEIARERVGEGNYAVLRGISSATQTQYPYYDSGFDALGSVAARQAAKEVYRQAHVTDPFKQLDFGVVHDCFTITELLDIQDMGLCKMGEAAELSRAGEFSIDGAFPINPDGGLKCFGHPIGATGCRMIAEVTRQVIGKADGLQVKNAKAGFAHNLGGPLSVCNIAILSSPDWEP